MNLLKTTFITLAASLLYSATIFSQYSFNQPIHNFQTIHGSIQLGPMNGTGAHIYTNLSKFYFNKDVYSLTGGFSAHSTSNLFLKTNGATRMTVLSSNGNVGINVTTPYEKLHIDGNIRIEDNNTFRFGDVYGTTGSFLISHASNGNTYCDINKGSLYFRRTNALTNNGAILGIQSDGTVTVGVWEKYDLTVTNTDGHKLMVNGGILCEKIKVIADVPNSDHVFLPSYKLRSLSEVKAFVTQYKHLPEVPSAEEFQKNGYNVGEMDDLLLRKVEELTLYLIQLEEANKALEEKVKALEITINH